MDGEEAEVLSLDGAQLAVAVPAGTHDVRLEHRPTSLVVGLAVSAASVLVGLVLCARRRRGRPGQAPPAVRGATAVGGTAARAAG